MHIVNFGSMNIDRVYHVENFVEEGETIQAKGYAEYPGGKGLNQSIALAKAGMSVHHIGKIGVDGQFLKDILEQHTVNVDDISISELVTGHAVIQVNDKGDNSIIINGGANNDVHQHEIDRILSKFEPEDVLVLQNEINNIDKIIATGKAKGMTVVLNPSPITNSLFMLDLKQIDYLIMNEQEALALAHKAALEEAIKYYFLANSNMRLVITSGKNGARYIDQSQTLFQEAYEVEAVDTTAAGDTFLGFFVASMIREDHPQTALKVASKAAAIAVSRQGAAVSVPSLEEVLLPDSDR